MLYVIKSKGRVEGLKQNTYKLLKSFNVEDCDIYIFVSNEIDFKEYTNEFVNCKIILGGTGFSYLVKKLFSELKVDNLTNAGIYICDNIMFMRNADEITHDLCFITDPFSAVINNKNVILTCDPKTRDNHKSDYEKSILHFADRGGVVRLNKYCLKVARNENSKGKGGGVLNRDKATDESNNEYMMNKYPEYISSIKIKKTGFSSIRFKKLKSKYDMSPN